MVSDHGLEVALERSPRARPCRVRLPWSVEERLPEPLEVAAYYLVSEGLANVGKYARGRAPPRWT